VRVCRREAGTAVAAAAAAAGVGERKRRRAHGAPQRKRSIASADTRAAPLAASGRKDANVCSRASLGDGVAACAGSLGAWPARAAGGCPNGFAADL
jgi:hypothetical protein